MGTSKGRPLPPNRPLRGIIIEKQHFSSKNTLIIDPFYLKNYHL